MGLLVRFVTVVQELLEWIGKNLTDLDGYP